MARRPGIAYAHLPLVGIMASPVSPSPLLTNVLQLVRDLARAVTELGPTSATRPLLTELSALAGYCESRGVDVDMVVAPSLSPDAGRLVTAWLAPSLQDVTLSDAAVAAGGEHKFTLADGESVVRVAGARELTVQRVASPRAGVLMLVGVLLQALDPEEKLAIGDLLEHRALVVILSADPASTGDSLRSFALEQVSAPIDVVEIAALRANEWPSRIAAGAPATLPAALRSYAALYGVETAAQAMRLIIEQELRGVRLKRAAAQQHAVALQQPATNPMELITEARTRLARTFGDFERGVQDGLRNLFLPQVGSLAQAAEQYLARLDKLDQQKGERYVTLRIGDATEKDFFALVEAGFRDHCMRDVQRLATLFESAAADGNALLAGAGATSISVPHALLSEARLNRLLGSAMRIDHPYRGEMLNHGALEYLQQAKKYQTIVAAVGFSALSLTKLLPPAAIIGVTVAATVAGLVTMPQRVKRERREILSRELERARDVMRGDARRMFAEVEREWMQMVSEALRDEQASFMQQFEVAVRESQLRSSDDLADDRRRLQRQLSGLEGTDRLLATAKRTRDTVENSAGQLRHSLRQQLAALGQPARRTP
jgi:hypothetical protein